MSWGKRRAKSRGPEESGTEPVEEPVEEQVEEKVAKDPHRPRGETRRIVIAFLIVALTLAAVAALSVAGAREHHRHQGIGPPLIQAGSNALPTRGTA